MMAVLSMVRPGWRDERIWELAPAGPASLKLERECERYVGSHFWPDVPPGTVVKGYRCEDVERPTFDDGSFDVIVSSDVFEHIIDVDVGHSQIARVLADGGVHVWTVPQYRDLEITRPRVRRTAGGLEHLEPAEYHGDPVCADGVLVTFDWGRDLPDRVEAASGLWTSGIRIESHVHGLLGEFLEVFVSHRGARDSGVHHGQSLGEPSGVNLEHAKTERYGPRVRFPSLPPWRRWWGADRLRAIRATIRRWRGRRQR